MLTVFRYWFVHLRRQTLGWGLALAGFGLMIVAFYDRFAAGQGQKMLDMIQAYPPEFLAFFGSDPASIVTPAGFLGMYGFSMLPPIFGIFGIIAGSGLLATDEEQGRLDLILAHPVSRAGLFWGRLAALVVAALAICAIGWLGFSLLLGGSSLGLSWGQMAPALRAARRADHRLRRAGSRPEHVAARTQHRRGRRGPGDGRQLSPLVDGAGSWMGSKRLPGCCRTRTTRAPQPSMDSTSSRCWGWQLRAS